MDNWQSAGSLHKARSRFVEGDQKPNAQKHKNGQRKTDNEKLNNPIAFFVECSVHRAEKSLSTGRKIPKASIPIKLTVESLKQKTFKGTLWSTLERFSVQGIAFVVMIIMARILTPDDYGLVGMLTVFIA